MFPPIYKTLEDGYPKCLDGLAAIYPKAGEFNPTGPNPVAKELVRRPYS
jgi:hypothetical protein